MSATGYPIILTNGTRLGGGNTEVSDVSVSNSVADTSLTSINLLRRGATNYSEAISETLVHMLENFSSAAAPSSPLTGQLWFNSATQSLQFYNGSAFSPVNSGVATGLANPVTISLVDAATNALLGSAAFDGTSNISIPFTLNASGVVAGTYTSPTLVIDAAGRIKSATASSLGAGSVISALGYTPANDALVVHKSGDTMTGTLNVAGGNINAQSPGKIMQDGAQLLPRGCIVMFAGSTAPTGWGLCDGTNGTPNLSGMFVVGIGGSVGYTEGQTGGNNFLSTATGTGGAHTHTMDSQGSHTHGGATGSTVLDATMIPSHSHPYGTATHNLSGVACGYASGGDNGVFDNISGAATGSTGGGLGHNHSINADGVHTHNITAVGDHTHSVSFDNRPTFYALAYIMKL